MIKVLKIDFETRGIFEIGGQKGVGLFNYFQHPLTQILMMAYKLPGETVVQIWEPHKGPMPEELRAALLDPDVLIEAFNSAFERYALHHKLGITIPPARFIDPQVGARYLSLPADLDSVCEILNVPAHLAKDKRGKALIDLFSKPKYPRKKKGEAQGEPYFNDWNSHPAEWQEFLNYCARDVEAEEEVMRRLEILQAMPMPEFERKLWIFDQTVNDRGIPVDMEFVTKAYALAKRAKKDALDSQNKLTGLENANSRDQLLPWAKERGYPYNTLNKSFVEAVLSDSTYILTDECREVLTARLTAGSNSYTKLAAIIRLVCPDSTLKNQFLYLGSSRCGRWSGSGVQPHNLPRTSLPKKVNGYDFEDIEVVVEARKMIYNEDYEGIKKKYGSVLEVIKSLLRTAFVAPEGKRMNVADLNAIETRTGAWLAECSSLLDVFKPYTDPLGKFHRNGKDPYLAFGAKFYSIPFDILWANKEGLNGKEAKSDAKRKRQVAKIPVLAGLYRMGGGGWGSGKASYIDEVTGEKVYDRVRTGLFGFAHGMGVDMSQEEAHSATQVFRNAYPEICGNGYDGNVKGIWVRLEDAILDVMDVTKPATVRYVGPNDCVKIDKLNISGRLPILRMTLPSGRRLHYMDAEIQNTLMPWTDKEGKPVYRPALWYATQDQTSGVWTTTHTHGGKEFENLVQGIARDILAHMLILFEQIDCPVVLHVHDEGGCLVPNDPFSPGVDEMIDLMSQEVWWAPGLLLGADGFEGSFYRK